MLIRTIAAAVALFASPVAAAVFTYDVSIPTTGTPDPATISFTIDFDAVTSDLNGSTAGITVNSLNFDVDGDISAVFPRSAATFSSAAFLAPPSVR